MPQFTDLGLANDSIVSVERTSGSGQPGQTDTYTITLRSGTTFTFQVTNGANGQNGENGPGGSPMGVYSTVAALTEADPSHLYVYLVLADGHWYYYDSGSSAWADGGVYLGSGLTIATRTQIENLLK